MLCWGNHCPTERNRIPPREECWHGRDTACCMCRKTERQEITRIWLFEMRSTTISGLKLDACIVEQAALWPRKLQVSVQQRMRGTSVAITVLQTIRLSVSLQGKDHTLFALINGKIQFHTRKYPSPRRFVSVQEQLSR